MEANERRIQFKCLGTTVKIILVSGGERGEGTAEELKKLFFKYEKRLSRFKEDSEVSELNRNLGEWVDVSGLLEHLARRSLFFYQESAGSFDPRTVTVLRKIGYDRDFKKVNRGKLPDEGDREIFLGNLREDLQIGKGKLKLNREMDFTGIAKGYIVDQAAQFLKKRGRSNFLVEAGGDIFASGKNKQGNPWHISIEGYPEDRLILAVSGKGIATTGISRKRWRIGNKEVHHLISVQDPGKFNFEIVSVTALASSSEAADAWAKILFLMGREKGMETAEQRNIPALFLDNRGNITHSSKLKPFMVKNK